MAVRRERDEGAQRGKISIGVREMKFRNRTDSIEAKKPTSTIGKKKNGARGKKKKKGKTSTEAVIANVYHVGKGLGMKVFNTISPTGGAYHVAIEAFGYEIGYGASRDCKTRTEKTKSGVYTVTPKKDPGHTYYRSERLGSYNKTEQDFQQVVGRISAYWRGCDYNLTNHNCVSFAQALAYLLLGEKADLPPWMSRLMEIGDALSPALPVLGAMSFASSQSSESVSDGAQALAHLSQEASRH